MSIFFLLKLDKKRTCASAQAQKILLSIEIAPRLAAHEVAAVVASRPRPTAAAFIFILAGAAVAAVVESSERL